MTESKAMVLGCQGRTLSREEVRFYRGECPWGFILFARNISETEQIRDLVAEMRDCVGRDDAPVFIDQEGGRVQRIRPPLAPNYPAGAALGALWQDDHDEGERAAWLLARLHAFDLRRYGITVDCLPVLDVPVDGASDAIGSRAYGNRPEIVAALGRATADGLMAGGVLPVMKHMPGHGRALADTHFELPTVTASLGELQRHDFAPFRELADLPIGMTAHVVFSAIDPVNPATTSGKVIDQVIRGEIGFDGLLISDDTSMKALSGDFPSKAAAILAAGCDIVLHCNGDMGEMAGIASRTRGLEGTSLERAKRALARISDLDAADEAEVRAEFASYFEATAVA
ncbi:beta-N-acetylhexosaminidase [Mesorhizobium sp. ZMM04-5]|uniref:beta-N-acetylhexosaminidase n=1 Tax=Mesorhizobium marinum TaxID=3228790 RepID=A0ABV3QZ37_9HYPH